MLDIGISNTTNIGLDSSASASCLEKTMRLANANESTLISELSAYPTYWEFIDRIFCWLHPEAKSLIVDFYEKDGPTLEELLKNAEIKTLDNQCEKSLRARLSNADTKITDQQMVDEFRRIENELDRTPTLTELGEHSIYPKKLWQSRFGSNRDIVSIVGETIKSIKNTKPIIDPEDTVRPQKSASQKECVKTLVMYYLKKTNELGHPPSILEMEIWDTEEFDKAVIYFRGWKNFIAVMKKHIYRDPSI